MNESPLISVIVPFYNIREFAAPCIESLLHQDFDDFEVICIDDGSTDGTSEVLDSLASTNKKIHVVHSINGGVSKARNLGVSNSRGHYISFVDGDDIISPYYLSSLLKAMKESECNLSIGRFKKIKQSTDSSSKVTWQKPSTWKVYSRTELIDQMLYENPMIASWGHLCKKDIYIQSPFIEGRIFEDSLAFKAHVLWTQSAAVIDEPIYGYRCRSGSITDTFNVSQNKLSQLEEMLKKLKSDIMLFEKGHARAWRYHQALEYARLARLIHVSGICASISLNEIQDYFKENCSELMQDKQVPLQSKIRFSLLRYCSPLYYIACDLYEKVCLQRSN